MRDNTPDKMVVRWEVLKSMLDDFPQLRFLAGCYLQSTEKYTNINSTPQTDRTTRDIVQKALSEYHKDRPSKFTIPK